MRILTDKRGDYIRGLQAIHPKQVMTFSYPHKLVELFSTTPIDLLIYTKAAEGKKFPSRWRVRTNNKVHAKLAIGKYGLIIGSWNFSDNSTNNMHEVGTVLKYEFDIGIEPIVECREYFERLWRRSKKNE